MTQRQSSRRQGSRYLDSGPSPLEYIESSLDLYDWQHFEHEFGAWCSFMYRSKHGDIRVVARYSVSEEVSLLRVTSHFPFSCGMKCREEMARFFCRVNSDLDFGSLDLDPTNGDAHVRTSMEFLETDPDDDTLRHLFIRNLELMEQVSTAFYEIAFDETDAKSAFEGYQLLQEKTHSAIVH